MRKKYKRGKKQKEIYMIREKNRKKYDTRKK